MPYMFPYDSLSMENRDRAEGSEALAAIIRAMFTDGVVATPLYVNGVRLNQCTVRHVEGMTVAVDTGAIAAAGHIRVEDVVRELTLDGGSSLPRIDAIVYRHNDNLDTRSLDLYVVKGTHAQVPTAPEPTRNNVIWEMVLAHVPVPAGASTITAITDTRMNSEICGFFAAAAGEIDTSYLYEQVQKMLVHLQNVIDGVIDGSQYMLTAGYDGTGKVAEHGGILETIFHVGCIHQSTIDIDPATYFGFGTWERIGQGRVLVGVNEDDSDFSAANLVGGSKNLQAHTHNVPAHQAPTSGSHVHNNAYSGENAERYGQPGGSYFGKVPNNGTGGNLVFTAAAGGHVHSIPAQDTTSTGSGSSQNMQPYITCFMWTRTA